MNVLVERSGPVTTVIMNRPELRNAVDEETASQLLAAFEAFESKSPIVEGNGPTFLNRT